jgi:hypothetical protein
LGCKYPIIFSIKKGKSRQINGLNVMLVVGGWWLVIGGWWKIIKLANSQ